MTNASVQSFGANSAGKSTLVLTGVLAGVVHGRHPGALLAGGRLLEGQVEDVHQSKLLVVPQNVGVDVIVDPHVLCQEKQQNQNLWSSGVHGISRTSAGT